MAKKYNYDSDSTFSFFLQLYGSKTNVFGAISWISIKLID